MKCICRCIQYKLWEPACAYPLAVSASVYQSPWWLFPAIYKLEETTADIHSDIILSLDSICVFLAVFYTAYVCVSMHAYRHK